MKVNIRIALILTLLSIIGIFIISNKSPKVDQLRIEGTKLVDQNGNIVILRGVSFSWHNWWAQFYSPDIVKWLKKDWKCSVIRLAIGIETENGYLQNPEWAKDLIKSMVDIAVKEGIYIIIDWHSHNINENEANAFFYEMAKLYGKYPNVIYEIFNEPDNESWDEIKAYSEKIITTIRKVDPDNIILIGSPQCDQRLDIVADNPIKGYKNIMYSLHFYAASHKDWLRKITKYAIKNKMPLFVSECSGSELDGNGPYDYIEMKNWLDLLDNATISWIIWSVSDKKETSAFLKPKTSSFGNWKTEDLKEAGKYTRKLLRNHFFYNTHKLRMYSTLLILLMLLWFYYISRYSK